MKNTMAQFFLAAFLFASAAGATAVLSAKDKSVTPETAGPSAPLRLIEVVADVAPVYARPDDSLPPVQMAMKKQRFPFFHTYSDDSGRVWFSIQRTMGPEPPEAPGKQQSKFSAAMDTGWVLAEYGRYVFQSPGALAGKKRSSLQEKEYKKRRYEALRSNPGWPRRVRQAVRNGEIVLSLSKEQLEASWGAGKSGAAFMVGVGKFEILYFRSAKNEGRIAVFVQNDQVTGWEEE